MHIKKLVVCGFKSYRGKAVVEEIDPGVNVIVGRNGSGKSNLFAAIEFALTMAFRHLRSMDRSALMYQGKQLQDPSYVEIVFDNSDRKLPVDDDTVTFRRMLAAKKDKFFVNGKELSNAKQFLDIAGFSNPYFIVKQGKVNQLAVGSDDYRMKLLQDVAGSSEYDNKINNCKRSLRDGETKQLEIQQILKRLTDKKKGLDEEATELKEFLKVDKIRRAIEYVIHGREENAIAIQVEKFSANRDNLVEKQGPFKIQLAKLIAEYEEIENEIVTTRQAIRSNEDKKEATQTEVFTLVSEIEKLKNQREDLEKQTEPEVSSLSEELQNLWAEQQDQEDFICQKSESLAKMKTKESNKFAEFIKLEGALKEFENNFLSEDKDSLVEELRVIKAKLRDDSRNEVNAREQAAKQKESLEELRREEKTNEAELDQVRAELKRMERSENLPTRSILDQKRIQSDMWRNLNEIDQKLNRQKEIHSNIMEQFKKRAGRPVMDAWEGVQKVIQTFKTRGDMKHVLDGYYGIVIENIESEEYLDRAIESALGRKLYHHIVRDTSVGMEILKEFNRKKFKGDVCFISLNQLNSDIRQVALPDDDRSYRPLLANVGFPSELERVAKYLFGKTLVAKDLESAVLAARLHKWNCVTVDGDKVQKGGPITGGFTGSSVGPLEIFRSKMESENALVQLREGKLETESKLDEFSKTLEKLTKQNEASDTKRSSFRLARERLTVNRKILVDKCKRLELSIQSLVQSEETFKRSQMELDCRQKAINKIISEKPVSCNKKNMKEAENLRRRMKVLAAQRTKYLSEISALEVTLDKAKQVKRRLNDRIQDEKNKQCDQLSNTQREVLGEELDVTIDDFEVRRKTKQQQVQDITATIKALKTSLSSKIQQSIKLGDNRLKVETELIKIGKELEGIMSLHVSSLEKLRELKEKSTKIASIPSEIDKYSAASSNELYDKLKKIKSKTADNDGVNQKALEQYEELNSKYEEFSSKQASLDAEKNALYECIEDLEERRGQAAYKCFVTLQEEFQGIFSNIVTSGKAELVLYGEGVEITSKNMKDSKVQQGFGRFNFTGLKINVNFVNRRVGSMKNLMSLSGGQKALVALSLILAVQKIDPVPFYLFDEVDQALDPQYRESVAEMMQSLSAQFHLQFICTTFRKEFLRGADKVYGVSYTNKVSNVRSITPADALEFVESESAALGDELSHAAGSVSDDSSGGDPATSDLGGESNESEELFSSEASASGQVETHAANSAMPPPIQRVSQTRKSQSISGNSTDSSGVGFFATMTQNTRQGLPSPERRRKRKISSDSDDVERNDVDNLVATGSEDLFADLVESPRNTPLSVRQSLSKVQIPDSTVTSSSDVPLSNKDASQVYSFEMRQSEEYSQLDE